MIKINRRHGTAAMCDDCNERPSLFEARIGRAIFVLCRVCLDDLKAKAHVALKAYKKFLSDKFLFKRVVR